MSFEELNFLHRNPNMTKDETAQLLTMLQGIERRIDDSASSELIIYDDEIRIRTSDEHVNDSGNYVEENSIRRRLSTYLESLFRRRMPSTPNSYPLLHYTFGVDSFLYSFNNKKFGGSAQFLGGRGIIIQDHTRLKPTDKIVYAEHLYISATVGGDPIRYIITKGTYLVQIDAHTTAPNQIRLRVIVSGSTYDLFYTYTPDTWFHLAFTWKSPNFKVYVNGTLNTSRSDATGTLDSNTLPLGIGTANTGNYTTSGFISTGFVVS